jgi:hypothetical protein
VFVGYSDITAIHTWLLQRCGLVSFHGPMLEGRFADRARYDRDSFVRAVSVSEPMGALVPPSLEIWRDGEASGVLVGGTITQLAASLGTPFAFDPPPGCVLFFDEVNERPYRLDRLLTQLCRPASSAAPGHRVQRAAGLRRAGGRCAAPTPSAACSTGFAGRCSRASRRAHAGATMTLPFGVRRHGRRARPAGARHRGSRRRGLTLEADKLVSNRIHFIGICGTAMATVAAMLKARGWDVRGSDQSVYPPMSTFLREQGIAPLDGYRPSTSPRPRPGLRRQRHLARQPRARSGARPQDPLLLAARAGARAVPVGSRSIVVAGTHGKTTTTSLVGWLLHRRPGAIRACWSAASPPTSAAATASAAAASSSSKATSTTARSSTRRRSSSSTCPTSPSSTTSSSITPTSIANFAAVELAFKRLGGAGAAQRRCCCSGATARARGAGGPSRPARSRLRRRRRADVEGRARLPRGRRHAIQGAQARHAASAPSRCRLLGAHNVRNALAGIAVCATSASTAERIAEGLKSFAGVKRRLSCAASVDGIEVYDDFATIRPRSPRTIAGAAPGASDAAESGRSSSRAPRRRA